jgi:hypothetical protein
MRRFLVLVAAAREQTDTFRGTKTTFDFTHMDTGVHRGAGPLRHQRDPRDVAAPGVAIQIQVACRPGSSRS